MSLAFRTLVLQRKNHDHGGPPRPPPRGWVVRDGHLYRTSERAPFRTSLMHSSNDLRDAFSFGKKPKRQRRPRKPKFPKF